MKYIVKLCLLICEIQVGFTLRNKYNFTLKIGFFSLTTRLSPGGAFIGLPREFGGSLGVEILADEPSSSFPRTTAVPDAEMTATPKISRLVNIYLS